MRTALLTTFLFFTSWASASANWFNKSEAYLAACQDGLSVAITKTRLVRR